MPNDNDTLAQSPASPAAHPAFAPWAALVGVGALGIGLFIAWLFSGNWTSYNCFPSLFLPAEHFRIGSLRTILITACVAAFFTGAWVAAGRLAIIGQPTGILLREQLARDARFFLSLLLCGCVLVLAAADVTLDLATLFVLIIAVTPPLALLACRIASAGCPSALHGRRPIIVLAAMIGSFCLLFAIQTIRQYHALNLGYADSGYVAEALANTLRGRFLWCNSFAFGNLLGDHFSPILLLVLPIYALYPVHETLLAVHSVAIGLGAVPVYLLARRLTRSEFAGLALAAAYLLHPAVQLQNFCFSYAFKAVSLGIPLLLWAAYFAIARRPALFVLFGILALACEESLVPVVLSLGIYAGIARKARAGWLLAGVAAAWWLIAVQLVMPWIRGGAASVQLTTFYGWMGGSPSAIAAYIVGHPLEIAARFLDWQAFVFILEMALPVAMLCFLSPGAMAAGAITFVFLVLSRQPAFLSIAFQYKAGLVPVLFLATAVAMGKLSSATPATDATGGNGRAWSPKMLGCFVLAGAAVSCWLLGPTPWSCTYVPSLYRADRYAAVREIREIVPRHAALLATERVAAHFTDQLLLHRQGWKPRADYQFVLLDLDDSWVGRAEALAELKERLADPGYAPVYAREGFVLFQKGAAWPADLKPFGPQPREVNQKLAGKQAMPVADDAEIAELQFGRPPVGVPRANAAVLVYWRCLKPISTDRGCVITIVNRSADGVKTFSRLFHPCHGLFPTSLWKPGMIIADRFDMLLPFDCSKGETKIDFQWKELVK